MENVYVRYSSSCSSSWNQIIQTIYILHRESAQANIETVVQCNWVSWSGIRNNSQVSPWSTGSGLCGKGQPCLLTRQLQLCRLQKPDVFSDSVLCVGGISSDPVKAWKEKIDWFTNSRQYREPDPIDGEPMEFEWKNFPKIHYIADLRCRFRKWWLTWSVNLSNSKDESSSCQCISTLYGEEKETGKLVLRTLWKLQIAQGHWSFSWAWIWKAVVRRSRIQTIWRLGQSRWYYDDEFTVKADIPVFRGSSAFGRLEEQRKRTNVHTIQWQRRNRRGDSSFSDFRQSAQCLRSSGGYVWRIDLAIFTNVRRVRRNP